MADRHGSPSVVYVIVNAIVNAGTLRQLVTPATLVAVVGCRCLTDVNSGAAAQGRGSDHLVEAGFLHLAVDGMTTKSDLSKGVLAPGGFSS